MATVAKPATLADLMGIEGKAELVDGEIVRMSPIGFLPGQVAPTIAVRLLEYAGRNGKYVSGDCVGYAVEPTASGRQSFSPDAAYYTGPLPADPMHFLPGPPTLAVEVRSANDYVPAALRQQAVKRADYFAAGTLAVWDVDPIAQTVGVHRADGSTATYSAGDAAEAEPACPGWRVAVRDLFPASLSQA